MKNFEFIKSALGDAYVQKFNYDIFGQKIELYYEGYYNVNKGQYLEVPLIMKFSNNSPVLIVLAAFLLCSCGLATNKTYYCDSGHCLTVWKGLLGDAYIVDGKYYGLSKPVKNYIQVHRSKYLYVCWNDDNQIGLNIGSAIIAQDGFANYNFYTHDDFFKEFAGQYYIDGKLLKDSSYHTKENKYRIQYIEL